MFKWLNKFGISRKDIPPVPLNEFRWFMQGLEAPDFGGYNYQNYALNGYQKNLIVYHCINKIAGACADVPLILTVDGNEIEDDNSRGMANAIAKLIHKPNDQLSYKPFMFNAVAYRLISGNTYFHLIQGEETGKPYEIELFRPDRVTIETRDYIPINFVYTSPSGTQTRYAIDYEDNKSKVLQVKTFNPLDDLYGLSPISAALMAVSQHNSASKWNQSLLQNSSKPEGFLSMKDRGDNAANLTPVQIEGIRSQVRERLEGPKNAGKIAVFNYDMQWQSMGLSPIDMDWLNGKNSNARDICLAFGYPAFLLGLPDAGSTYNNVEQAKLSLYEDTVIPILNNMVESLGDWLSKMTDTEVIIKPDLDKVSALTPRRQIARENARLDLAAGIITTNEAREEIGYEEVDGGDEIMVPAGKLPINFDLTGLDEQKFHQWLLNEGVDQDHAKHLVKLAFTKNEK